MTAAGARTRWPALRDKAAAFCRWRLNHSEEGILCPAPPVERPFAQVGPQDSDLVRGRNHRNADVIPDEGVGIGEVRVHRGGDTGTATILRRVGQGRGHLLSGEVQRTGMRLAGQGEPEGEKVSGTVMGH